MKRLLAAVLAVPALVVGLLAAPVAASTDGYYGDYGIARDVSTGFFQTLVRDGANSQNYCSVIFDNDTANLRKYAGYLRTTSPDDWVSWSGSRVVQASDLDVWQISVPANAINDSQEPFIRISTYVFNVNTHTYDFTGYVTLNLYNPTPDATIINYGTLGSHQGGNWTYC